MNKKMRELLEKINGKTAAAKEFMDGENKDIDKANKLLDEADELRKEFNVEKKLFEAEKAENTPVETQLNGNPAEKETKEKEVKKKDVNGFKVIGKMVTNKRLNDNEKELITGGSNGENYLIPEDVRLSINELRKQYKSAKNLVTLVQTDALSGSFNYESGEISGLVDMTDGSEIDSADSPKFTQKKFAISFMGKLIPISRILLGAEKASLLGYINRWFLKNAIYSENTKIFDTLKKGKTVKAIKGWKALKTSINKDLDPDTLYDAVIVTNQTGFTALDNEVDANDRPILQLNPADPTQKLFQGLPIEVFSDTQLPNVSGKAPIFYGSLKAGCNFIEYMQMEFATSEHVFFGKNQNALRVIEGFDVMQADTDAYIYGTFEGTATATATA